MLDRTRLVMDPVDRDSDGGSDGRPTMEEATYLKLFGWWLKLATMVEGALALEDRHGVVWHLQMKHEAECSASLAQRAELATVIAMGDEHSTADFAIHRTNDAIRIRLDGPHWKGKSKYQQPEEVAALIVHYLTAGWNWATPISAEPLHAQVTHWEATRMLRDRGFRFDMMDLKPNYHHHRVHFTALAENGQAVLISAYWMSAGGFPKNPLDHARIGLYDRDGYRWVPSHEGFDGKPHVDVQGLQEFAEILDLVKDDKLVNGSRCDGGEPDLLVDPRHFVA